MTTYGLTPTGLVIKPLTQIVSEITTILKQQFGSSIGSNPDGSIPAQSNFGQLLGTFSEREALLWELLQSIVANYDPDLAVGVFLDAICMLTGTIRLGALPSTVVAIFTGNTGTVIATLSTAQVTGANTVFGLLGAPVTLAAATAWATSTIYAAGAFVTAAGNIYYTAVGGTSAGSGSGPTGTGSAITDNTVTWAYVGQGVAFASGTMTANTTGPLAAVAGSLVNITSPISGWQGVNNIAAALVGRNVETDAALRLRRVAELAGNSVGGPADAIRAALLKIDANTDNAVTAVTVFQNTTMTTDGAGRPPKSIECLVTGGVDQDVIQGVWNAAGSGITTYGTSSGTATDSEGTSQTVGYSRPSTVPIYVSPTIIVDVTKFPANGVTLLTNAILAQGALIGQGINVVSSFLAAACWAIPGVLDVEGSLFYIGTSPSPTTITTINMTIRQIPTFTGANINISIVDGTP